MAQLKLPCVCSCRLIYCPRALHRSHVKDVVARSEAFEVGGGNRSEGDFVWLKVGDDGRVMQLGWMGPGNQ